jgi:hypothetical protein
MKHCCIGILQPKSIEQHIMINKEILTLAFLAKTRIDTNLNKEIQVHSKV